MFVDGATGAMVEVLPVSIFDERESTTIATSFAVVTGDVGEVLPEGESSMRSKESKSGSNFFEISAGEASRGAVTTIRARQLDGALVCQYIDTEATYHF